MNPVFYDCEASGLHGVPIEIGWAFSENDGLIVSEGHLIRPPARWKLARVWDEEAEALHGISQAELARSGKPPFVIARRMNAALAGRELFSDSPFDEAWLRKLLDEAGENAAFTIRRTSAEVLIEQRAAELGLGEHQLADIAAEAERTAPRTHRAEADARHLARLWVNLSE
jgi:DNA polymerase III epsilon subunit-like protein